MHTSTGTYEIEVSKKSALIGGQPIIFHMEITVETAGMASHDTLECEGEYIPQSIESWKITAVAIEICNEGETGFRTGWTDFTDAPKDVQKMLEDLVNSEKDFEGIIE